MSRLNWLPSAIHTSISNLKYRLNLAQRRKSLLKIAKQAERKIIIGAGGTNFIGWVPTEQDILNLLQESDWKNYFELNSLDAILAEHVWEHLTAEEAQIAARNCFNFLKPGGYLRVAVPDGFHPDTNYIEAVRPGGTGSGSDDHKVLFNYKTFGNIFQTVGFEVQLYEYFDESGAFVESLWEPMAGMIQRSKRFDERNLSGRLAYTSIILDAKKRNN